MPKLTVTLDGTAHEVEAEAVTLPDGYALFETDGEDPKGYFSTTHFEAEKARVAEEARKGLHNPATLVTDAKHQQRVLKAMGITLGEDGLPVAKLSEEDRKRLTELDRLTTEHAELASANERLTKARDEGRRQSLINGLLTAFDQPETYLSRDKLETFFDDDTPPFIEAATRRFEWNDEHDTFVFRNEKGNIVFGKDGKPAGARAFAAMHKQNKPQDFEDTRQRSTEYRDDGRRRSANAVTRKQYEEMSPAERQAHFAKGGTVND